MEIIYILLGVLVIGACSLLYRYYRRKKAYLVVQTASKKLSNEALRYCLQELEIGSDVQAAQVISDVWGKGVLAFEYQIVIKELNDSSLKELEVAFNDELGNFAKQRELLGYLKDGPIFLVSDIWLQGNILHVDIAHLVNQATVSYVKDMKTLAQNN